MKEPTLSLDGPQNDGERTPLLQASKTGSSPQRGSEGRGYLLMALSCIGFSSMSMLIRIAEDRYAFSPTSAVFVRSLTQTTLVLLYVFRFLSFGEIVAGLTRRQWGILTVRGLCGGLSIVFLCMSLQKLPVGETVTIFFCNPVITIILASVLIGETGAYLHWIAAAVSFTGVVMIVQTESATTVHHVLSHDRLLGALYALGAAVVSAVAYVCIRYLGTGIHFMTSILSLSIACIVLSAALGGIPNLVEIYNHREGPLIVMLASLFGFAGQCCLNKGFQLCPAGKGALIRNLDVPAAYLLGMLFLGESPTAVGLIGSGLVICASVLVSLNSNVREADQNKTIK